jgi:GDP-L-fucose synthase
MPFDPTAKVFISGANGMVGGQLARTLRNLGFSALLTPSRSELDLKDRAAVISYFEKHRPDYVFLIAARVGGIQANIDNPLCFLTENLRIQDACFAAVEQTRPEKTVFLGSSCIYPRECSQPMQERALLTGPLEPTNEGYALAKIVGLKTAQYLAKTHNVKIACPMPCNLYGTGDHFEYERAHVLSSLVRRFVDARDSDTPSVTLWGDGSARREFLHVADMVRALLFFAEHVDTSDIINVGPGTDVSIGELAQLISAAVEYSGEIRWDTTKPNGMPRKCLDVSVLNALGFEASIPLMEGIQQTVREYEQLKKKGI